MQSDRFSKYWWILIGVLAGAVIFYVLFMPPQPGVADQGDFDRITNVSGLELKAEDANNPDLVRFNDYTITEYQISAPTANELFSRFKATSMAWLISFITLICTILGQDIFKTGYLALAYVLMYGLAFFIIFKYAGINHKPQLIIVMLLAGLVFLDGNYLVWFNSLYGEPMMITTLLLYIAAWIYYIHHRYVRQSEQGTFTKIIYIYLAAFLFIGSKLQVVSALPVVLIMLIVLVWENRSRLKRYQTGLLYLLSLLLILYSVAVISQDKDINIDRQYNAVFYGILKDSPDPALDLAELGLNPDLAVESGKHSYLAKDEYVKYAPHAPITYEEFYSQISTGKLLSFYISHPDRLIQGMSYTASQAFTTSTLLGKYTQEDSQIPIREFERFTHWSSWREQHMPQKLLFLTLIYVVFLAFSLNIYLKNRDSPAIKTRILLLWSIMVIGLLQFPMPFLGNGQADTAKQLYLFNFTFDLMLIVAGSWCIGKISNLIRQHNVRI